MNKRTQIFLIGSSLFVTAAARAEARADVTPTVDARAGETTLQTDNFYLPASVVGDAQWKYNSDSKAGPRYVQLRFFNAKRPFLDLWKDVSYATIYTPQKKLRVSFVHFPVSTSTQTGKLVCEWISVSVPAEFFRHMGNCQSTTVVLGDKGKYKFYASTTKDWHQLAASIPKEEQL